MLILKLLLYVQKLEHDNDGLVVLKSCRFVLDLSKSSDPFQLKKSSLIYLEQ